MLLHTTILHCAPKYRNLCVFLILLSAVLLGVCQFASLPADDKPNGQITCCSARLSLWLGVVLQPGAMRSLCTGPSWAQSWCIDTWQYNGTLLSQSVVNTAHDGSDWHDGHLDVWDMHLPFAAKDELWRTVSLCSRHQPCVHRWHSHAYDSGLAGLALLFAERQHVCCNAPDAAHQPTHWPALHLQQAAHHDASSGCALRYIVCCLCQRYLADLSFACFLLHCHLRTNLQHHMPL